MAASIEWATSHLAGLLRTCFPSALRCLRAIGYEHILVVRGFTHLALWFTVVVSFSFSVVWFLDVVQLRCATDSDHDCGHFCGPMKCVSSTIGFIVFSLSFMDAVQMTAHFDDHQQRVLAEKWRALNSLTQECSDVLATAKANVEKLRERVMHAFEDQFVNFVKEVFTVILPCLDQFRKHLDARKSLPHSEKAQTFCAHTRRFVSLCKAVLGEVENLVSGMRRDLEIQYPEVFERIAQQVATGTPPRRMQVWDEWIKSDFPLFQNRLLEGPSDVDTESALSAETSEKFNLFSTQKKCKRIVEIALSPVLELLNLPEHFEDSQANIEDARRFKDAVPNRERQRVGWGKPPQEHGGCCIPYTLAVIGRALFMPCVNSCCNGCCKSGLTFNPPKVLNFGFCWVQIHTKLHERLIQGIIFAIAYFCMYATMSLSMFQDLATCPYDPGRPWIFVKTCALSFLGKSMAACTMFSYFFALSMCLYRIDRLDTVMETIETIWKLEDLQNAVRAFDKSMEEVHEQVVLFKGIEDRILTRADAVLKFGVWVSAMHSDSEETTRVITGALGLLNQRLSQATTVMRPPSTWCSLSSQQQNTCALDAKQILNQFVSELGTTMAPSGPRRSKSSIVELQAIPQSPNRPGTFSQSSQGSYPQMPCTGSEQGSSPQFPLIAGTFSRDESFR